VLHGFERGGAKDHGGLRRTGQTRHPRTGGKSANIIFADANLEKAAAMAPYAVFDNAGQDCCARSRILVEENAYERFMELFEVAVKGVKVLDPSNEESEMGPLITGAHRASVAAYVEEENVAFRGSAPQGRGFWFAPTVLETPDRASRAFNEEIFDRSSRWCAFAMRVRRSRSRTTGPTDCRVRSGRAISERRCESRAGSRPGRCR